VLLVLLLLLLAGLLQKNHALTEVVWDAAR
jgi:hypothetical protein